MTSSSRQAAHSFGRRVAVVMGTNEIASAVAVYLYRDGWRVVLSHDPHPPVIRRRMAFHDALFGDPAEVGGVWAAGAETSIAVARLIAKGKIAVTPLGLLDLIPISALHVLADARMQKRDNHPDLRHLAHLTVGIGPGFAVGRNCDIAVETLPAKNGAVVCKGSTEAADGRPRLLGGAGAERFMYSDAPGRWHSAVDIGTRVYKNFPIGILNGKAFAAPLDGVLRGVVRDGTEVLAGVKLLEIDPRGRRASWTGIDERGATIARAAMTAIARKLGEPVLAAMPAAAGKIPAWLM
ncbi:MAG: xanthine dehydrogenase [Rhodomicrobium sp.]